MREKLFISIYESCRHRPTAISDAIGLTDTIINQCLGIQKPNGVIRRSDVILIASEVLTRFDTVAGTYYTAYHRK